MLGIRYVLGRKSGVSISVAVKVWVEVQGDAFGPMLSVQVWVNGAQTSYLYLSRSMSRCFVCMDQCFLRRCLSESKGAAGWVLRCCLPLYMAREQTVSIALKS